MRDFNINKFSESWHPQLKRSPKLGFLGGALLGGLGGALLGSGGGGKPSQVVPQPSLLPNQMDLIDRLALFLGPQTGTIPRVPGPGLAPPGASALQQQAFGLGQDLPGQVGFDPNQITQQFQPTADFARQGFQQETIPAIMASLGAQGAARSSGAADILGRQGRQLEQGLAAQLGQQQFGAQQAALGRQFQLPAQLANLGSLQRGIGSEQQAFNVQRFQAADPLRNPALQLALQTAGLSAFQQPGVIPGTPSTLSQLLPLGGSLIGGAGAAGGFSNLFS